MEDRGHYLKAFLIAGLLMGVLSAIPVANCCCCIWVIGGGGLAGYLLCQWSKTAVTAGEGALVGLFAGLIGGVLNSMSAALQFLLNPNALKSAFEEQMRTRGMNVPPELEQFVNQMMDVLTHPVPMIGLTVLFSLIFFGIMGMLGAMIGVSIFEPRFALARAAKGGMAQASGPVVAPITPGGPMAVQPGVGDLKETVSPPGAGEQDLYFPRRRKEGE